MGPGPQRPPSTILAHGAGLWEEFDPAVADCGCRAPLAPHLVRSPFHSRFSKPLCQLTAARGTGRSHLELPISSFRTERDQRGRGSPHFPNQSAPFCTRYCLLRYRQKGRFCVHFCPIVSDSGCFPSFGSGCRPHTATQERRSLRLPTDAD